MQLRHRPYTLELKHAFTIATSSRTTTPAVLVEVERDGVIGYGEAAMPPQEGASESEVRTIVEWILAGAPAR